MEYVVARTSAPSLSSRDGLWLTFLTFNYLRALLVLMMIAKTITITIMMMIMLIMMGDNMILFEFLT